MLFNDDKLDQQIDKIIWGCLFTGFGFILGLLQGKWHRHHWEEKLKQTRLRMPDVLEIDSDDPLYIPITDRPWAVRHWQGVTWTGWMLASCSFCTGIMWLSNGTPETILTGLTSLLLAGLVAGLSVTLWLKRRSYETLPELPTPPPLDLSAARVYTITLPRSTEWLPHMAGRFMHDMLHKTKRLTFQIIAEPHQVTWRIIDLRLNLDPSVVADTVLAFYPAARVEHRPLDEELPAAPCYRYVMAFEQITDPLLPMKVVDDFKLADPLVNLTHEVSGLRPGERISYTVFVADFARYVYNQAEDLLTVDAQGVTPFQLFSAQGWAEAGYQFTAQDRQRLQVYDPHDEDIIGRRLLEDRVYQCLFLIQVDAPTRERVEDLSWVEGHIHHYWNFPHNGLMIRQDGWRDHIVYVDPADPCELPLPGERHKSNVMKRIMGWVLGEKSKRSPEKRKLSDNGAATTVDSVFGTSTLGVLNRWLTNEDMRWQQHRLLLDTRELAGLWHLPHRAFTAPNIVWGPRRVQLPHVMWGNREGVALGVNEFAGRQEPVFMLNQDRATHGVVLGKTGVGKSTLLHHLIHQDILQNRGVAVIDPHGKLIRDILRTSIPPLREDDVVVLDLANTAYPAPLNPLRGAQNQTTVGQLISVLDRLYGRPENAPRMTNALLSALMTLRADPQATVRDVVRLFRDTVYRHQLLDVLEDTDVAAEFWEEEYENFSVGQQGQIRDPVIYRLRPFYTIADLYPVICHPNALDFGQFMREGKIILVSLGMDEECIPERERHLVGALIVSQLQMAAMRNGTTNQRFYLYIDEVQNFVTSSLEAVFSGARKYGLSLTVANQYLQQLAGGTLDALMGNVGAMVTFQPGLEDARRLAPYMSPGFDAEDLIHLDKYQAVVKLRFNAETQPAFSLTSLLPLEHAPDADEREQRIRQLSIQQYTPKTRDEVLAWLKQRYPGRGNHGPAAPDFYES